MYAALVNVLLNLKIFKVSHKVHGALMYLYAGRSVYSVDLAILGCKLPWLLWVLKILVLWNILQSGLNHVQYHFSSPVHQFTGKIALRIVFKKATSPK